jgi:hypothetical protein
MADERCSVNVWEYEITGAMEAESPERVELLREIMDTVGQGEAHPSCFEYALENGLESALEKRRSKQNLRELLNIRADFGGEQ